MIFGVFSETYERLRDFFQDIAKVVIETSKVA